MLSITSNSQESIYAQITPAPEKFGSNDDVTTDALHDSDTNNVKLYGITPSERIDDAAKGSIGSIDSTESNDVNSDQTITATEQSDETITTEKQDFDPSNQLVEAIMDEVNEALSASGIFGP